MTKVSLETGDRQGIKFTFSLASFNVDCGGVVYRVHVYNKSCLKHTFETDFVHRHEIPLLLLCRRWSEWRGQRQ